MKAAGSVMDGYIKLAHNGFYVPQETALENAERLYFDFIDSFTAAAGLTRLCQCINDGYDAARISQKLSSSERKVLSSKRYALEKPQRDTPTSGKLAKTAMAHNMVQIYIEGEDLMGELREPFPEIPLLGELYASLQSEKSA